MNASANVVWTCVDQSELVHLGRPAADEVHVWLTRLDTPAHAIGALRESLSADERARAARFVFERDRLRFETGRGWLRLLLAAYTGSGADTMQFDYGSAGKPALRRGALQRTVEFNLSHSEQWALLGVAACAPVGVDIEAVRDVAERESIADSHFTAAELQRLREVPAARHNEAFIDCWAQKEACVKALGEGLGTIALDQLELVPERTPAPADGVSFNITAAGRPWSLVRFEPDAAFRAAVAVGTRDAAFRFFRYDSSLT